MMFQRSTPEPEAREASAVTSNCSSMGWWLVLQPLDCRCGPSHFPFNSIQAQEGAQ